MTLKSTPQNATQYAELCQTWGVALPENELRLALTHRSWAYEHDAAHNERLEFLGDAILGLITVDEIYHAFPAEDEGMMSKYKSASVSEVALAIVARELDLGKYIRLGKGEAASGGANKDSILSDTVEALIAVTYLQYGLERTREIVLKFIKPRIATAVSRGPALDWRTSFEEMARAHGFTGELTYKINGTGPDHARVYTAEVFLANKSFGIGKATSQKNAKLAACEAAYKNLQQAQLPQTPKMQLEHDA